MEKLFKSALGLIAVLGAMVLGTERALATVPTGVETVFTAAATDFGVIVGYGWTLFLVIVGGLVLFGIVRRVIARSAGR